MINFHFTDPSSFFTSSSLHLSGRSSRMVADQTTHSPDLQCTCNFSSQVFQICERLTDFIQGLLMKETCTWLSPSLEKEHMYCWHGTFQDNFTEQCIISKSSTSYTFLTVLSLIITNPLKAGSAKHQDWRQIS